MDLCGMGRPSFLSCGFFSVGVAAPGVGGALPKSKAVPGVFGVLDADPNEANAPDPNPKALEPPVVGEDMEAVARGDMVLKGLFFPCDEVGPNLLAPEKSRPE